jgi:lysophospholipase L1-like esterase
MPLAAGVRKELRSLGVVLGAIVGMVVLAGTSAVPVLGRGVRTASAAPLSSDKTSTSASALPVVASVAPSVSATAPAPPPPPVLMSIGPGTRVLLFGDSFVGGLQSRLKHLVEERGGTLVADPWVSSTTTAWAKGSRLTKLLSTAKPDVVFIALGANEVFLPAPETRAPAIRAIVQRLGGRSCAWISPVLWKGETGITAVSRANAPPCAFFDSSTLTVETTGDKIHPSAKGGAAWADAVWSATVAPAQP